MLIKDNTTLQRKAALRFSMLKHLKSKNPMVMECHGGYGKLFDLVYAEFPRGVVFETVSERATALALQRPTWRVYEAPSQLALKVGAAADLPIDFVDLDPYGECWPAIEAYFGSEREFPKRIAFAVNDGLRQKLTTGSGWQVATMKAALEVFSNDGLRPRYLEVCRWNLQRLASPRGYRIVEWAGYYCGFSQQMTHFGAVLERAAKS